MGLAQAAVLQHLLDLTRRLSLIAQGDDGPDAIQRLLERTRILADEGSLLGGKFMSKLGFVRRKQKTANKRSIWELDLSRPAAPGTNLHQARRLIAERLGLPDRQNIAPPGWKERWENLSSKMFGYTE
jgi:hypothetical protein